MKNQFSQFNKNDVDIKSITTKYHGFFKMDEYQLSHALFNGGKSKVLSREMFERGDAVVLIPYDPVRDTLVFVEQFRVGAMRNYDNPWVLEFVAGMFDANESPEEVAIREAKEEANLTLTTADLLPITKYLSSPGGMSECIHIYVGKVDASNASGVYGLEEEGEDIKVHEVSRVDALALMASGKINNASTIIGVQWIAMNYQKLQAQWQT